jgi:DNA-binding MarR family transcriptional regulator
MADGRRPIGYWLKEIDRLIEEDFGRLLAGEQLTRRHWQVLNTVAARPVGQTELDEKLAPFVSDDQPSTAPVVADLAARGWLATTADGSFALTADGVAAHTSLHDKVTANRIRLTQGITADEYAAVVDLLERMAANLAKA